MTHEDFRKLVLEMRTAQKNYFRLRTQEWLEAAKDAERAVDEALKQQPGERALFK